jgi:ABC-type dipeptide/oligopeptide/nickel transport system permease component
LTYLVKYTIKRILMLIPVLLGVSLVVFLIMRVFSPDPAPVVLGEHASKAAMTQWRDAHGLNDPIVLQFFDFLKNALTGNFGTSYYTNQPVSNEIMSRFPATVELAICAIIFASVLGVILGAVAAVHKNTAADYASTLVALVGISMPIFWLGILLIILFSGVLHILPSTGRIDPMLQPVGGTGLYIIDTLTSGDFEALGDTLKHLVMPTLALSLYSMAIITRMTRSSMLDALNQDYIRTARAKGISESRVVKHHALRNAMIPVTTVIGLQFGSLLGGAVLTETVFAWPGIGSYTVECIQKSDFPVVQAVVLIIATIYVIINLIVDLIYALLDPRIKYAKEEG